MSGHFYFKKPLFLDDVRQPKDTADYISTEPNLKNLYLQSNWHIVKDYDSFVQAITTQGLPDCISFDFDLGQDEKGNLLPSGYDCAKWLIDYVIQNNLDLPDILCHSMNPVGRENILCLFESYKKHKNSF